MAFVTHQIQGSYATFPSSPLPWSKGMKLKRYVEAVNTVGRTDRCLLSKHNLCLSVGAPRVCGPRVKLVRISAFKGSTQNDESESRASGSKVPKKSAKLSYAQKENEETIMQTPKGLNIAHSHTPETTESIAGSPAIHKLFKKWLTMLHTESPSQPVDEILGECLPPKETSEIQKGTQSKESSGILKAVWGYFLGLDATIKIPLVIFIPLFLAVNVIYGAEVSKELTPMWVLGPLIVALYIKMLRWLCELYIFTFKQTVKVVKNLPTYYLIGYTYITQGKLKEGLKARIWQPVVGVKNLDYKEVSRTKLKELQVLMVEKYLDFVESIWPFYCRTIRFLKRANLI